MESPHVDQKTCAICGLRTRKKKFCNINGSEQLKQWHDVCTTSVCNILLEAYSNPTIFRYFENGDYCKDCLQIMRDIDFTWRQIENFKKQMSLLSASLCKLIHKNYVNIEPKSERSILEERLVMMHDDVETIADEYPNFEIIEIIYLVITKLGLIQIEENADDAIAKKVKIESNEGFYFPHHKWPAESPDNNSYDFDDDHYLENTAGCSKNVLNEIQTATKEDNSEILAKRMDNRLERRLNRQVKILKRPKKYVTKKDDSHDEDWNPSIKKSSKRKKLEQKEISGTPRKGRPSIGSISQLILDETELNLFRSLPFKKESNAYFSIFTLSGAQRALLDKLKQCTVAAVEGLNLDEKEKTIVKRLRYRFKKSHKSYISCSEESCGKIFRTEDEVDGHVRQFHEGEELPFYCTSCPLRVKSYQVLMKHRSSRHNGLKLGYNHFCKICHKGYAHEEDWKIHCEESHQGPNPFSCAYCDEECTTSTLLINHMNKSHDETKSSSERPELTCEKCGKSCLSLKTLKNHLLKHELQTCEVCNKTLSSSHFRQHMKSHYDPQSKFVCEICGKEFALKTLYTKHAMRHKRELKYKCSLCDKAYHTSCMLRNHERVHSGVRQYICPICNKAFFTEAVLRGHRKTHEPGYIPRKPIRRKKQKAEKKVPREDNPSFSYVNNSPQNVSYGEYIQYL